LVSRRMPELVAAAARTGIWLVEDAAHAHGSSLGDTMAGAFGIAGAFSFYPTKVMTAAEGGMIVTNDERIACEARRYRHPGQGTLAPHPQPPPGSNRPLPGPPPNPGPPPFSPPARDDLGPPADRRTL